MIFEVDDIARVGSVADIPGYMLPPEIWTFALNMRYQDDSLITMTGWEQIFGSLPSGNDSFTKVLLHCDGVDASTAFPDSNLGGSAHTWTAAGNAQIDTAQSKFGSASFLGDGTGDWVNTPAHADFNLGSGNFTVDFWFNCTATAGSQRRMVGQFAGIAGNDSFFIFRETTNVLVATVSDGVTSSAISGTTQFTDILNTGWHHAVFVRTNNVLKLFIDGVQEGGDVAFSGTVPNSTLPLQLGDGTSSGSNSWIGWLDEFRLSVGVARWTANFTPPTAPYANTAQTTPHFAMAVAGATNYWLYASLVKAFVFNGVSHIDVTRTIGGDYATTDTWQWNGTILGGIPIFNNGVDVPQFWAIPYNTATPLANLTNWDATKRARVIRAFGDVLIAINLTEGGVAFPHRVLWSHGADAGFLPPSWDDTDPTRDAGEADLPDVQSGVLVDALPLGSTMFLYKQSSIWKMRFVGGQQIFDFGQSAWLATSGCIATRCVCVTGDGTKHVVATQDDIIWHDGNTVNSILNKRQRRRLQSELSTTNYFQSFMFANPYNNEVWFCYPQQGSQYPDKALIMNYKTAGGNDFTVTEADGITFRNAAIGDIEAVVDEAWNTGSDTWDTNTGPWSEQQRRRVILSAPALTKFYKLDQGETRDGLVFTSTLRREGLALIGKKQNGDPVVDFQRRKMLKRLWPKIVGTGPVNVKFGMQTMIDGATTWGPTVSFNPVFQVYCDPGIMSGRAVGFEITRDGPWRLDGYKIDLVPMGEY